MTAPTISHPDTSAANRREALRAAGIAAFTMLLTLVPYLIGYSLAENRIFLWLGYNFDDSCVYLSWMRQAADGSLRAYNLFTTEPQSGMALNPLFLAMGRIAGWTGLPLLAVYHGARMLFGLALLAEVWLFLRLLLADAQARWLAFLCVCFSSGLGWLPFWWDIDPFQTPIDKWQPEAITFLSLYLSPLFAFSMLLQVGIVHLLFLANRAGRMRYAVSAGLCGFLLGLTHTYDVLTMAVVWAAYLLVQTLAARRSPRIEEPEAAGPMKDPSGGPAASRPHGRNQEGRLRRTFPVILSGRPDGAAFPWLAAGIAGAITLPAVLIIAAQLRSETVFRARAMVPTLSASLHWVLLGYGLTLALAVFAALLLLRALRANGEAEGQSASAASADAVRLLIMWAVVNILVSYLPGVPFQRKLLQGAHFPIAILAGIGAAALFRKYLPSASASARALAVFALMALLFATNARFLIRDIANYTANITQTKTHRPYLLPGEMRALEWLAKNTPQDAAVQPLLWRLSGTIDATLACITPGMIHRKVYCGHWGETPDYGAKVQEMLKLLSPRIPEEERKALLRKMQVRYLVFSQKSPYDTNADTLMPMFRGLLPLPPYLKKVYPQESLGETNPDADIYEVDAELLAQ